MNLLTKAFAEIFTFSRASGGGRINALGVFEWLGSNVQRIDHSPINLASGTGSQTITLTKDRGYAITVVGGGTVAISGTGLDLSAMGASSGAIRTPPGSGTIDVTFTVSGTVTAVHVREVLGILIEEQRTNIAAVSSGSAASVFPSGAACSKGVGSAGTGYAGGAPGTIAKNAIGAGARGQVNYTITPGGVYSASIRVKKPGAFDGDFHAFGEYAETNKLVVFNPYTGVISFQGSGLTSAKIKDLGLWWGVEITCSMVGSLFAASYFPSYNQDGSYNESNSIGTGASRTIDGLQIEQGSFVTSYIPTSGSQATRAADVCSINTLSPWFKASEGTVFVEYDRNGFNPSGNSGVVSWYDSTKANYQDWSSIGESINGGSSASQLWVGGVSQANQVIAKSPVVGQVRKSAMAFAANNVGFASNGVAAILDTSAALASAPNVFAIGGEIANASAGAFVNGHIRRLRFWTRRRSESQILDITA